MSLPPGPGLSVAVGRGTVELCHRVATVPGRGTIWHARPQMFLFVSRDVTGAFRYSVLPEVESFLRFYGLPVENLGGDYSKPYMELDSW